MRFIRHIVTYSWPLALAVLLLSGIGVQEAPAPPAAADALPAEWPSVVQPDVFAPAALLPFSCRAPSVAERPAPGGSQFEGPAGRKTASALSARLSYPASQRAHSTEGATGLPEKACSLLCVFRC